MSPTLLELVIGIIVLIIAWQIGITIAPMILRSLRNITTDIDKAAKEALESPEQSIEQPDQHEENNREIQH